MDLKVLVLLLLPVFTATSNGSDDSHLAGSTGASYFFHHGLRMEQLHKFQEALNSLQTATRLLREVSFVHDSGAGRSANDLLMERIHNASWEVKVRDVAHGAGLGSSMEVEVEVEDSSGPLPVRWVLGDDLRRIAQKVCCEGSEGLLDTCFDFEGGGEGDVGGMKAAKTAGVSCSVYVHGLLEVAEQERRDYARLGGQARSSFAKARPARYVSFLLRALFSC